MRMLETTRPLKIAYAMLLVLSLAGCGAGSKIGDIIDAATAPITNPVSPNNIHQVKLTFNLAVKGANKWASLCWGKTYRALMVDPVGKYVCVNRRQTRRTLIEFADKADAAIKVANTFIRNNPTFSPVSVIDDAWQAVLDYKSFVTPIVP